jgi:fumarate reductase flavoprotein subunit
MAKVAGKANPERVRKWDAEADVVIVGGGGAGLGAGIEARERGATVIVLEKERNNRGANSARAAGTFAVESPLQKEKGINYTRDEAFRQAIAYSHWLNNVPLVRKIIDISADTIDWLLKYGVQFKDVTGIWADCPKTWHLFIGDPTRQPHFLPVLTKAAGESGVKILYRTPATGLIAGPRGRVIGVEAETDGQPVKIRARGGVILASGGFGANKEMLKKYTRWDERFKHYGCRSNTGDGIRMAEASGASLEGMDVLLMSQVRKEAPGELWVPSVQAYLFVDKDGQRVVDESIQNVWTEMGNVILRQKDHTLIVIFDEDSRNTLINTGAKVSFHIFWWEGKKATKLDEEMEMGLKRGFIKKAATIKELARAIKVNPETLENTVARYNQSCDKKYDDMYLKDPRFLEPVRKPPFYAMICDRPEYYVTLGGTRINADCQVLDSSKNVIPGLYAVGNDAGGMWIGCYNPHMSGGCLGFAINSGRIAGENAAGEALALKA